MENQRVSTLIAEILFGICFILAFFCIVVGAVCVTGFKTNQWYLITRWMDVPVVLWGYLFIVVGVLLGVLGASIKSIQAIFRKLRANKEFKKAQAQAK